MTVEEDGADFRGEPRLGGEGALVRGQREGVLLLAGDRAFTGEQLGGLAHVQAADRIGEAHFQTDARLEIRGAEVSERGEFFTAVLDLASTAKWRVALS